MHAHLINVGYLTVCDCLSGYDDVALFNEIVNDADQQLYNNH